MKDLVGKKENRFSHDAAHYITGALYEPSNDFNNMYLFSPGFQLEKP